MSADERFAERAELIVHEFYAAEDQKKRDTFETLMQRVDAGELTLEAAIALQRDLGAVAVADLPASPYQTSTNKRLERDFDAAQEKRDV